MSEIVPLFEWFVKAFMWAGCLLLLVCLFCGFWFIYELFTVTLYSMRLSHKWNRFRAMSPHAQKEAMSNKKFKYPDESSTDPRESDRG